MIRTVLVFIALCASIVSASTAGALNIDIYGPGQSRVNLFIAEALSKDGAGALSAILPYLFSKILHAGEIYKALSL